MIALALLPFALSCAGPTTDSGGGAVEAPTLDVAQSERIPTVYTVSGRVAGGEAAWVEAARVEAASTESGDVAEARRVQLPVDPDGAFEAPVLGLKPATRYSLRVVTAAGLASPTIEVETGSLPPDLPLIDAELLDPEAAGGGWLVTGAVVPPAALIVDRDGDIVWWYQPEGVQQLGRVRLSRDHRQVLMADLNLDAVEETELIVVSVDGSEELRRPTTWQHHDFVERADGTIAYSAYDPRWIDDDWQEGDRILELAPDGSQVEIYNQWDHHAFTRPPSSDTAWPHANALDLLEGDDDYLLSLLLIGGIARIDRATGQEEWFLGGPDGTLRSPEGREIAFDYQHGMDLQGDRLKVFVNGFQRGESSAVELQLDPEAGTATETWLYEADPALYSPAMGDVQVLPGGNTLVTFSLNGAIHEVRPDGVLAWSLSTQLGGVLGYVEWLDELRAR